MLNLYKIARMHVRTRFGKTTGTTLQTTSQLQQYSFRFFLGGGKYPWKARLSCHLLHMVIPILRTLKKKRPCIRAYVRTRFRGEMTRYTRTQTNNTVDTHRITSFLPELKGDGVCLMSVFDFISSILPSENNKINIKYTKGLYI